MKTRLLAATAALALTCGLTACTASGGSGGADTAPSPAAASGAAAELAELYELAQRDGEVVWYHQWVPDQERQVVDAFTAAFPGVKLTSMPALEATQRFASESKAGATSADVLSQSEQTFAAEAAEEGWIEPLAELDLPGLDDFPAEFVRDHEVVHSIEPIRLLINTDLVTQTPQSWEDLTAAEYADQIMMLDPRAILPWLTFYDVLRETFGIELLSTLSDQAVRFVESVSTSSQTLGAGEAKALVPGTDSVATPLAESGAPVAAVPLGPVTGIETTTMVASNARHPHAARLLTAWLSTEDGQRALNGNELAASPMQVEGSLELGDDYQTPDIERALANREAILDALGLAD